jgi:hypothetical protein
MTPPPFAPAACAVWQTWLRNLGGCDIAIGHRDLGRWNVVG